VVALLDPADYQACWDAAAVAAVVIAFAFDAADRTWADEFADVELNDGYYYYYYYYYYCHRDDDDCDGDCDAD
jgi:hypothetical protein